jgi:hypothetical protein
MLEKTTLIFEDAVVEEAENVESSKIIRETLRLFSTVNLDLVDIKLSVLSNELAIPVLTWDKGFSKLSCEYYSPSDVIDKEKSEDD